MSRIRMITGWEPRTLSLSVFDLSLSFDGVDLGWEGLQCRDLADKDGNGRTIALMSVIDREVEVTLRNMPCMPICVATRRSTCPREDYINCTGLIVLSLRR
jgi:hypothetical protein